MKRFCKNLAAFSLMMLLIAASLVSFDQFVVGNQYSNSYTAALLDKMDRLESLNSPKLILIGNSNVAFGFDSSLLEAELGMPVVNMGLHGSLGNAFHEEAAKQNIQAGDILVVCHTDYSDNGLIDSPKVAWITLEKHYDLWSLPQKGDFWNLVRAYPEYALKCFLFWAAKGAGYQPPADSYARQTFNEYGDIIYRPDSARPSAEILFEDYTPPIPKISNACVQRLNELNAYAAERGATLLVAGYPIAVNDFEDPDLHAELEAFQENLSAQLDCPVISDFTNYLYPYDAFYDTRFHLTEEGAVLRTRQLLQDWAAWQASRS